MPLGSLSSIARTALAVLLGLDLRQHAALRVALLHKWPGASRPFSF
jgi:hypothetical protein